MVIEVNFVPSLQQKGKFVEAGVEQRVGLKEVRVERVEDFVQR